MTLLLMNMNMYPFSLTVAAPSYVHPTFTSIQRAKVPAGLVPSTTRTIQVFIIRCIVTMHKESIKHMSLKKEEFFFSLVPSVVSAFHSFLSQFPFHLLPSILPFPTLPSLLFCLLPSPTVLSHFLLSFFSPSPPDQCGRRPSLRWRGRQRRMPWLNWRGGQTT